MKAQQADAKQEIIDLLNKNQDEWKCDEYDEELKEKRIELAQAETPSARAEIQHDISKIEQAMKDRRCSRFEDFG